MDLMMPGMDGLEATKELKGEAETSRIPILMLTALNDTEDRISAFDAGATGFLTKPFDRLELLAHVRSYINLSITNKRYVLSTANRYTGLPNQWAFAEFVENQAIQDVLLDLGVRYSQGYFVGKPEPLQRSVASL